MNKKLRKILIFTGFFAIGAVPFTAGYITGVAEPQIAKVVSKYLTTPTKIVEKEVIVERQVIPRSTIADVTSYLLASEEAWISIRNNEDRYLKTHNLSLTCRPKGSTLKTEVSVNIDSYPFPHLALVDVVGQTQELQKIHKNQSE